MRKNSFLNTFFRAFLVIALLLSSTVGSWAAVSDWQKSATIVPTSPTDFASDTFKQSLNNLAATGANYVALIIPYYQSSINSIDLAPGWNTPTDEALIEAINHAHSLGLKVMLKMHPEVVTNEWRGAINPEDREGWFNNYTNIVLHYATLAQQHGVEELCLGAEMFNMTSAASNPSNTGFWNALINQVKGVYSGLLTYSAQHSYPREAETIEFWNLLDYAGLAAYYPLAENNSNPTVEDLQKAWATIDQQVLGPLHQQVGKPIMFTEIGYRSMDGVHADPWDWGRQGSPNEAAQAQNYEALFSYWDTVPYMAGVHLWDWSSNPDAGGPGDTNYTPQNKQAEQVMTTWFGGSGETPTPTPTEEPEPTPTQTPEPTATPTPVEQTQVTAEISPVTPLVNENANLSVTVWVAESMEDSVVNLELYDPEGTRILQQYYENQNLVPEEESTYSFEWAPTQKGEYTIKAGIFSPDWQTLLFWEDNALTFVVIEEGEPTPTPTGEPTPSPTEVPEEPTPTPTQDPQEPTPTPTAEPTGTVSPTPTVSPEPTTSPTPSPSPEPTATTTPVPTQTPAPQPVCQQMHLSWPKKLLDLSGAQPLKAWIGNRAQEANYILYWKTEGQEEQVLFDSTQGNFQAGVIDFGSWNWQENESFTIELLAKDLQGNLLACAKLILSLLP